MQEHRITQAKIRETTFFASNDMGETFPGLHEDGSDGSKHISRRGLSHNLLCCKCRTGYNFCSADFGYTWQEVGDWGAAQRDILSGSGWIDVDYVY